MKRRKRRIKIKTEFQSKKRDIKRERLHCKKTVRTIISEKQYLQKFIPNGAFQKVQKIIQSSRRNY